MKKTTTKTTVGERPKLDGLWEITEPRVGLCWCVFRNGRENGGRAVGDAGQHQVVENYHLWNTSDHWGSQSEVHRMIVPDEFMN